MKPLSAILLWIVVIVGALVACAGCPHVPGATTLPPQISQKTADGIGAGVKQGATDVTTSAKAIQKSAQDGKAATPPADLPGLAPYWDAILAEVSTLFATGGKLDAVASDVAVLKAQMKAEHDAAEKALAEQKARTDAVQKKLDESNSANAKKFVALQVFAVVLVALSVGLGLLVHDFRYAVVGIAVGATLFVGALLAGVAVEYRAWIGGGIAIIGLGALVYEILDHKGVLPALFKSAHDKAVAEIEKVKGIGTAVA